MDSLGHSTLPILLGVENYAERGWRSKQLAWESLRNLRCEDCATTIDYVTKFRLAVQRLRNLGQDIDNDLLVFELISNLGSEHLVWSTNIKNNSRTAKEPPKWEALCAELLDLARMAIETNPGTALFQSKHKRNRSRPTKLCKACNTRGHDEENCFLFHPEKAPPGWEMLSPESPTSRIPPHALQLMAATEFAKLDSLHALNSHISNSIDMGHFSHLEDVWHIDSGASNHITRDRRNFSDYHLSSSKQKIWTGGGPVAVEGYGSVVMDWITRKGDRIPVILNNVLHVPGIITNLISVRKLDLKGIYWRSDDQTLRIVKTNKEVGASRIVGDLYAVMTDLKKGQHQAAHLRNAIHNGSHSFMPKILDKIAPTVDISGDQGWAEVLGVQEDPTKLSAILEEESVKRIIDIPRREDQEPPGLLEHDSPQQSFNLPQHPSVQEGRPKRNTRVPARYQGFALFPTGHTQGYKKERRKVLKDCGVFQIKQDLRGKIRYKACRAMKGYHHKYGDNHHLSMGVT